MRLYKPKGRDNYYVDIVVNGVRHRESTGTTDRAEAQRRVLARFNPDGPEYRQEWQTNVTVTLLEGIRESLKLRPLRNGSLKRYNSIVSEMEDQLSRPASSYRPDELASIVMNYRRTHSKSSTNNLISVIRGAYRYLGTTCGVSDATQLLKAYKRTRRVRNEFLEESEFKGLVSYQFVNEPDRYLVTMVLYYTGLRIGEAGHLEWGDIDFKANTLTVREKPHRDWYIKDDEEREIPLHREITPLLQARSGAANGTASLVFPYLYSGSYNFSRYLRGDCKAAGIKEVTAHILRHSFGTNLVRKGVPITVVKDLMGHSDISTTMIYQHVLDKDRQDAISVL